MEHDAVYPRRRRSIVRDKVLAMKEMWTRTAVVADGLPVRHDSSVTQYPTSSRSKPVIRRRTGHAPLHSWTPRNSAPSAAAASNPAADGQRCTRPRLLADGGRCATDGDQGQLNAVTRYSADALAISESGQVPDAGHDEMPDVGHARWAYARAMAAGATRRTVGTRAASTNRHRPRSQRQGHATSVAIWRRSVRAYSQWITPPGREPVSLPAIWVGTPPTMVAR
jgi:hypothetical protein